MTPKKNHYQTIRIEWYAIFCVESAISVARKFGCSCILTRKLIRATCSHPEKKKKFVAFSHTLKEHFCFMPRSYSEVVNSLIRNVHNFSIQRSYLCAAYGWSLFFQKQPVYVELATPLTSELFAQKSQARIVDSVVVGKGKWSIILHTSWEHGFLPECYSVFVGNTRSQDYHDEVNTEHFTE